MLSIVQLICLRMEEHRDSNQAVPGTTEPSASDIAQPPAWKRRFGRTFVALLLVGVLLRLTIRDRLPILAAVYYAMPWPVLTLGSLIAVVIYRRKRTARWICVGSTLLGVATTYSTQCWNSPPAWTSNESGPHVSVLFWNVARGQWRSSSLAATIGNANADLCGFVEVGTMPGAAEPAFELKKYPYRSEIRAGMLLVSRFPIARDEVLNLQRRLRCRHFIVTSPQGPLNVLLVDIASNPLHFRREPMAALTAYAQSLQPQATVILGDFNTPGDSVWFGGLREAGFVNAYEFAGSGYRPTWPIPVPVLDLDHAWVSPALVPASYHAESSLGSDHRPIQFCVRVKAGAG